jgi:squalene-hopene/tetraprenyl-beta-curcumene cyclase
MYRIIFILVLILCGVPSYAAEQRTPAEALAKAQEYLWSQQQDDGSWRSEQYAVMRSGQALTPFVLHTLLASTDSLTPTEIEKSKKAIAFIVSQLDDDGALGKADPDILEYPVYSTAYAILAIDRLRKLDQEASAEHRLKASKISIRLNRFLISSQFDEKSGFTTEMPAYGGWGFDKAQQPGDPGHMDLAHTRRAIDAAFALGVHFTNNGGDVRAKTQRFLAVVQKRPETLALQPVPEGVERPQEIPFDGGFYFSPVVLQANKGRLDKDGNTWRSYATATCDGILALLAAGVPKDDERVTAAVEWLKQHTDLDYPQGIPTDYPEPWGDALKYYHFAVRAEVYAALDFPTAEKLALAKKVAALERPDGSFANAESPLMKEDDPLLATALAVVALTHCTDQ